jgi:hypothetical protein
MQPLPPSCCSLCVAYSAACVNDIACCRHDLVEDLTSYLYNASLLKYIEGYVQKVSPQKTPQVGLAGSRTVAATAFV